MCHTFTVYLSRSTGGAIEAIEAVDTSPYPVYKVIRFKNKTLLCGNLPNPQVWSETSFLYQQIYYNKRCYEKKAVSTITCIH